MRQEEIFFWDLRNLFRRFQETFDYLYSRMRYMLGTLMTSADYPNWIGDALLNNQQATEHTKYVFRRLRDYTRDSHNLEVRDVM